MILINTIRNGRVTKRLLFKLHEYYGSFAWEAWHKTVNIPSEILSFWLLVDEPIGTAIGVLVVLCLIRQNLWAWPLGVIYILASVSVLLEGRLYANLLLHLVAFLPMNLYGWYYWIYGKQNDQNRLVVSWSDWKSLWVLILIWFKFLWMFSIKD